MYVSGYEDFKTLLSYMEANSHFTQNWFYLTHLTTGCLPDNLSAMELKRITGLNFTMDQDSSFFGIIEG